MVHDTGFALKVQAIRQHHDLDKRHEALPLIQEDINFAELEHTEMIEKVG